MGYIIVSIVTIVLFTGLIYVIANNLFKIKIHIKFLILCACCSLFISLILPKLLLDVAGLLGTVGVIALFAILSSFLITYYYDHSVRKTLASSSSNAGDAESSDQIPAVSTEAYQFTFNKKEVVLMNYLETVMEKTVDVTPDSATAMVDRADTLALPAGHPQPDNLLAPDEEEFLTVTATAHAEGNDEFEMIEIPAAEYGDDMKPVAGASADDAAGHLPEEMPASEDNGASAVTDVAQQSGEEKPAVAETTAETAEQPLDENTIRAAAEAAKAAEEAVAAVEVVKASEEEAKAEAERIAAEEAKAEAERIAAEEAKAEAERIAAEEAKAEAERIAAEEAKAEAERIAAEEAKAEAERIAAEEAKAEAERIAAEEAKAEAERIAAEEAKAEAERIAAEEAKAEAERIAAEEAKAEAERIAAEEAKAEAERIAAEEAKAEAERIAAEEAKAEAERIAAEEAKAEAERIAAEEAKAEAERIAAEEAKAEAERIAAEEAKAEAERIAEEEALRAKAMAELVKAAEEAAAAQESAALSAALQPDYPQADLVSGTASEPQPNMDTKVDTTQPMMPKSDLVVESIDAQTSSLSLDDLMDAAFSQKEQRHFSQALKTFRQALELHPDSEAAPFLVMEIGTILKNMGSYNEAIQEFSKGRQLPGVMGDSMLEHEFVNTIAYLRVVKNVLVKHSLGFIPFQRIPANVVTEINNEFSEWRSQS